MRTAKTEGEERASGNEAVPIATKQPPPGGGIRSRRRRTTERSDPRRARQAERRRRDAETRRGGETQVAKPRRPAPNQKIIERRREGGTAHDHKASAASTEQRAGHQIA